MKSLEFKVCGEPRIKVWRRWGGEGEFFAGDGMIEGKFPGVEQESWGGEGMFFGVDGIA